MNACDIVGVLRALPNAGVVAAAAAAAVDRDDGDDDGDSDCVVVDVGVVVDPCHRARVSHIYSISQPFFSLNLELHPISLCPMNIPLYIRWIPTVELHGAVCWATL